MKIRSRIMTSIGGCIVVGSLYTGALLIPSGKTNIHLDGVESYAETTVKSDESENSKSSERYQELQNFSRVMNILQQYYVEEVDSKKLLQGAIRGMLSSLDPHTNYLTPEYFKEFENETNGEFGGLGIEITMINGFLTVLSPIEDAPAWKAGVKAGDRILSIDGQPTKGLSLVECSQLLKGPRGSSVTLVIQSILQEEIPISTDSHSLSSETSSISSSSTKSGVKGKGGEGSGSVMEPRYSIGSKEYTIVRGDVKIKSVKMVNLGERFYYIKITSFIENTSKDLEKYLALANISAEIRSKSKDGKESGDGEGGDKGEKSISSHSSPINGLIIDLRNNPGGLFDQAVKVSDLFLKEGAIVSTMGRDPKSKEAVYATGKGLYTDFPLVILMNEYSASASEIFSGAMQDNRRGIVMGSKSFGKGSVQSVVKLGDGSALKVTVARYYTPSGRSIQSEGITPDIEIEDSDHLKALRTAASSSVGTKFKLQEKDLNGHLLGEKEKNKKSSQIEKKDSDVLLEDDLQLLQAYNYLKVWSLIMGSFSASNNSSLKVKSVNQESKTPQ